MPHSSLSHGGSFKLSYVSVLEQVWNGSCQKLQELTSRRWTACRARRLPAPASAHSTGPAAQSATGSSQMRQQGSLW